MSVSWGATRRFVLKGKQHLRASGQPPASGSDGIEVSAASAVHTATIGGGGAGGKGLLRLELELHDGDVLVMGGATQTTHRHLVPPPRKTDRPPQGWKSGRGSGGCGVGGERMPPGARMNVTIRSSAPGLAP